MLWDNGIMRKKAAAPDGGANQENNKKTNLNVFINVVT